MTPSNWAETFSVETVIKIETAKYIVIPDFYTPILSQTPCLENHYFRQYKRAICVYSDMIFEI
jgi:hypothetical protein